MFLIFSGPSGSGKNTVINKLMEIYPNMEILKSCTTRPMERGVQDNNYHFLSLEEFDKKRLNGEFFETEMVHEGLWYGTLNASLNEVIQNKKDFVKDIDVKGTMKIAEHLSGKAKVYTIFLDTNDDELRIRLKARGESDESIAKRTSRNNLERTYKKYYDLVIEDCSIDEEVQKVINLIESK